MNENENQAENQAVAPPPANPYAAPTATVMTAKQDTADTQFFPDGKVVSGGNGASWIGSAWNLFKKSPGVWIICFLLQIGISIGLNFVPLIGMFINILIGPVIAAGWIVMGALAQNDEPLDINQFFAGFQQKAGELFTVGAIYAGLTILMFVVLGIVAISMFGTAIMGIITSGDTSSLEGAALGGTFVLMFLLVAVALVGSFLIYATTWFAPALVMFHNMSPIDAMKKSFSAFMKNWAAFTILGLVYIGLCIASVFTLFLGLIVVIPLLLLTTYVSYRDIFTDGQ